MIIVVIVSVIVAIYYAGRYSQMRNQYAQDQADIDKAKRYLADLSDISKRYDKLSVEDQNLKSSYNSLLKENAKIKDNEERTKQRKKDYSSKNAQYECQINQNMRKLYQIKDSLMYNGEERAYYFMSKILSCRKFKNYRVFPQIRLAEFIELSDFAKEQEKHEKFYYDKILRSITSKSVDFVVFEVRLKYESGYVKNYIPRLVIELDGSIHRMESGSCTYMTKEQIETIKKNDEFKNHLFEQLELPLRRVPYIKAKDIKKRNLEYILNDVLLNDVGGSS